MRYSHFIIANLLLSPLMKEFGKSVFIWRSYKQEYNVLFFLTREVYPLLCNKCFNMYDK